MQNISGDSVQFEPPNLGQCIIIMTLGLAVTVSNFIVVYVIIRTKSLHSQSGVFMASGGLNDLTLGLAALVVFPYMLRGRFSNVFCSVLGYIAFTAIQNRLGILTLMSVDKCLTINYPFSYPMKMTVTRVCGLLTVIFIQAYVISLPVVLYSHTYREHAFICEMDWLAPSIYPYAIQTWIYIQLIIMTSSHVSIFFTARKQLKKIKDQTQSAVKDEDVKKSKEGRKDTIIKSQIRGIKTLFLLVGIFYLGWITYIVAQMMYPTFTGELVELPIINFLSIWLGVLNLACNGVLYYFTNKAFSFGFKYYVLHKRNCVEILF